MSGPYMYNHGTEYKTNVGQTELSESSHYIKTKLKTTKFLSISNLKGLPETTTVVLLSLVHKSISE